jgi:hypothetical protein
MAERMIPAIIERPAIFTAIYRNFRDLPQRTPSYYKT